MAYMAGRFQESSVATHTQYDVCFKITSFKNTGNVDVHLLLLGQELVKLLMHVDFCLMLPKNREQTKDMGRFLGLINVSEQGEFLWLYIH